MDSVIWPFEERVRIIKGFAPLEQPIFDNADEDTFRFNMWGLYHRVCEATVALNTVICLHLELLLNLNINMKIALKNIH